MINESTRREFVRIVTGAAVGASVTTGLVSLLGCGGEVLPVEEKPLVVGPDELPHIFTSTNTNKKIDGTAELPYVTSAQQAVIAIEGLGGKVTLDQSKLGKEPLYDLLMRLKEGLGPGGRTVELYFEQPVKFIGKGSEENVKDLVTLLSEVYKGTNRREMDFKGQLEFLRMGRSINLTNASMIGDLGEKDISLGDMYLLGPGELERRYTMVPELNVVRPLTLD